VETESLAGGHHWLRVADPTWADPLDPGFAERRGGRWNPPATFPTLYLNEDIATARVNVRRFIAGWPYEPEDVRAGSGPDLVTAILPAHQRVADAHSPAGLVALGLPASYPFGERGTTVGWGRCQPVGAAVHTAGLRGVLCRAVRHPAGRELAWFPATRRTRAHLVARSPFLDWFYA